MQTLVLLRILEDYNNENESLEQSTTLLPTPITLSARVECLIIRKIK